MEKERGTQKRFLPGHPLGLYQIDAEESPHTSRVLWPRTFMLQDITTSDVNKDFGNNRVKFGEDENHGH
jgi:hypothetical protein